MKIFGKTMDGHLASIARRASMAKKFPVEYLTVQNDWPCDARIVTEEAYLEYRSGSDPIYPHRPYLRFIGKVTGVEGVMGNEHVEIIFDDGDWPDVDILYDFTNEELSDMALKGLFDHGFTVPDIFIGNEIIIPVHTELMAVDTQDPRLPAIFFVDIKDRYNIMTNEAHSGYVFGEYFEEPEFKVYPKNFEMDDYGRGLTTAELSKMDEPWFNILPELNEDDYKLEHISEQEAAELKILEQVRNISNAVEEKLKETQVDEFIYEDEIKSQVEAEDVEQIDLDELIDREAEEISFDDSMDRVEYNQKKAEKELTTKRQPKEIMDDFEIDEQSDEHTL